MGKGHKDPTGTFRAEARTASRRAERASVTTHLHLIQRSDKERYGSLSARCHRLLVDGQGFDTYDSTHKVLAALMGGMHRGGWSEEQAHEALLDTTNVASRRLQVTVKDGILSTFGSKSQTSWDGIEQRHAQSEADHAEQVSILLTSWPVSRENATLRVALGLAEKAKQVGSMTFTASQRQIAEISGVGTASILYEPDRKTVKRALQKLQTWGLVASEAIPAANKTDELFNALTRFTLTTPTRLRELLDEVSAQTPTKSFRGSLLSSPLWSPPVTLSGGLSAHPDPLHVVWEATALGMSACRVFYLLIEAGALAPAEIMHRLHLSRRCVTDALAKLNEAGLIAQPKKLAPWSALPRSLDDVAEELGVEMRQRMRRTAFEQPRIKRRVALEDKYSTRVIDKTTGEIAIYQPTTSQVPYDQAQSQPTTIQEAGRMAKVRQFHIVRKATNASDVATSPTKSSRVPREGSDELQRPRLTLVGYTRQASLRRTTVIKRAGLGFRTIPVSDTRGVLQSEAVAV